MLKTYSEAVPQNSISIEEFKDQNNKVLKNCNDAKMNTVTEDDLLFLLLIKYKSYLNLSKLECSLG